MNLSYNHDAFIEFRRAQTEEWRTAFFAAQTNLFYGPTEAREQYGMGWSESIKYLSDWWDDFNGMDVYWDEDFQCLVSSVNSDDAIDHGQQYIEPEFLKKLIFGELAEYI